MPTMRVKTKFEAKDDVSSVARRIEKNVRKMNRDMTRGFKQSTRSALKFGGVLKANLASAGITKGLGLLSQGVGEVGRQFLSFDDSITAAAVRFKDIGPDSKDFALNLMEIKKAAREAGATTVFTADQSAKALDFLARAGFTSVEAMGSLRSMINLSVASGEDFAAVADMSSDLLGAFGLAVNDSAQKIKNLTRLNDVLVKTTNSANVTVENMFETMKQVGPIATGVLGASLEEVSALTAVLGNSGIKGSDAMTALKNAYLRLAAPVGEGAKLLQALNITLDDGAGGAKKMTDLMLELRTKMVGLGRVKQAEILNLIFGKRAIAGGKNILDNIANIKEFEKALLGAAGTSQKTADIMQNSLGNQVTKLGSAFVDLGFEILGGEEKFKSFVSSATERVNKLATLLKSFRKEEETPIGGTAADRRRALDRLNQGGKFDRIPGLTNFADIVGTTFFGQTIDEMTTEQMVRDLQRQTANINRRKTSIADNFRTENIIFPTQPQPQLNVNVENQINADGVSVESTVKAPGTSGGPGRNGF